MNAQHNAVGFCRLVRLEKDNPHVKLKCLKIIKHAAHLQRSPELQALAYHSAMLEEFVDLSWCTPLRYASRGNPNSNAQFKERQASMIVTVALVTQKSTLRR